MAETKQKTAVLLYLNDEIGQEIISSLSNAGEDFESKIKSRRFFFDEEKTYLCFSKSSAIFIRNYRRLCWAFVKSHEILQI